MSVGLLLVTHGKLGHHLLDTLHEMMGELPLAADVLEVRRVSAHEVLISQGRKMLERLDSGDGVLVLTDAFGSTPSNIANKLRHAGPISVVAGVNLPMLVRIFNYPSLDLAAMTRSAVEGGSRGIIVCPGSDS
ncbi:PTS fructose transporter subunit IIA [Sinimarinibacterium sp. CAU 1509]|uniref:PTS sugar transporter subunit IIA n=1 Tax=Sinimarinibacterium sp. CAU 1509 TaxID=2562283 RepID=UPI0010AC8B4E|nr:PTS fructose transporter subunit IIA [Sinimarinibacterium sp. CAU 1509]TJY56691.1 PTS fructose transporter subunit IIA [Sinimarinibacterium sp. CAU 1509]